MLYKKKKTPIPSIKKPLNPPVLGPGPSDIHPRVLAALARPTVGHLDPYYLKIMDELQSMLQQVFCTKNRLTMAISGTGSAGQEAAVLNLVEPGERVLVCINGVFGMRLADMAERAGGEVTKDRAAVGRSVHGRRGEGSARPSEAEGRRDRDGRDLDRRLAADRRNRRRPSATPARC